MKKYRINKTSTGHVLEVAGLGVSIEVWHFEPEVKIAVEIADQIHDAFAVANETGLTPRQLLEQRNELLEALRPFLDYPEEDLKAWSDTNLVSNITITVRSDDMNKALKATKNTEQ